MGKNNTVEQRPQSWEDLGIKDKIAIITACIAFCLGFVLLFVGLVIGEVGNISSGVLTGFGMTLVYTASMLGITMYFRHAGAEFYTSMMDNLTKVIKENKQ